MVRAEARGAIGLDPLVADPACHGPRVLASGRVNEVLSSVVSSSVSMPHKPNRNQVFPSGSLSPREEAIVSMGKDTERFRTL